MVHLGWTEWLIDVFLGPDGAWKFSSQFTSHLGFCSSSSSQSSGRNSRAWEKEYHPFGLGEKSICCSCTISITCKETQNFHRNEFCRTTSVAYPKWQTIIDFSNVKIKPPLYCLKTHFMIFISVHYCSPNTINQFLSACGGPPKSKNS